MSPQDTVQTLVSDLSITMSDFFSVYNKIQSSKFTASPATQEDYLKIADRIIKSCNESGHQLHDEINVRSARSTYRKKIISLRYFAHIYATNVVAQMQDTIKFIEKNPLNHQESTSRILTIMGMTKSATSTIDSILSCIAYGMTAPVNKRNSKRAELKFLPQNWRQQISAASIGGKYELPILVLIATGCRPSEMTEPVKIRKINPDKLEIEIATRKSRQASPPRRKLIYSTSSSNEIITKLSLLSPLDFEIESAGNLIKEITRIGKKLWPGHKNISAGSFRHAFAADLKKHTDKEHTAKSLGHKSLVTQKKYGLANQSRTLTPCIPETVFSSIEPIVKIEELVDHVMTSEPIK